MQVDLPDDFVARIRKLAAQNLRTDDEEFEVHSWSGGNVDDAFSMGVDEGEIGLAQDIAAYFPKD